MKKSKLFLTAFAVVAIVGSSLAVKANFFGSGSVYCDANNTCTTRVNFRIDPNGTATPCGTGITPHVLTADATCVAVGTPTHFSATAAGK